MRSTGPPGWRLGTGLTTLSRKKYIVTENESVDNDTTQTGEMGKLLWVKAFGKPKLADRKNCGKREEQGRMDELECSQSSGTQEGGLGRQRDGLMRLLVIIY